MRLAPSVLSFDLSRLGESMPKLEEIGAEVVHFDVMDGQFVPPITFGDSLIHSLRPLTKLDFEAHLMTLTPEAHFEAFAKAGCKRITFHLEATHHAHRHAQQLRSMGIEAGVSINPGTPVEALEPLMEVVDMVLIMTVNPGWGGQQFIPTSLERIRKLRAMAPDLLIQVDGGIAPDTIRSVKEAGADLFVVGSYLLREPTMAEAVRKLEAACG